MANDDKNPYEILGVSESASIAKIKEHYRQHARELHPDSDKKPDPAQFAEVTDAYNRINTDEKRENYAKRKARNAEQAAAARAAQEHVEKVNANREARLRARREAEEAENAISNIDTPSRPAGISVQTTRFESVSPPVPPRNAANKSTARLWITGGIALLTGIIILATSGGHSVPSSTSSAHTGAHPEKSRAEYEAEDEAKTQKMAEARIAKLSFKCLDGAACHADPEGHSLPIFINGMDENLREYLEQHGYRDSWSDSAGGINGQTIGPGHFVGQSPTIAYVAKAPKEGMPEDEVDTGAEFGSGLLYEERGEHENTTGTGVIPWDVHGGERWTIVWTLGKPSGQIVKQLEYSVSITDCSKAITYCEEADAYDPEEPANKSDYTPPPAFP